MSVVSRQDGFSLVEMLVVLSLLAVILTISLPYVRISGERQRLIAEGNMVAARLRETRSLALSTKEPQFVAVDLENRMVEGPAGRAAIAISSAARISLTTSDNLIIDQQGAVRFFPDGGSTGGTITLSAGEWSQTIAINWLTGAVTVRGSDGR